MRESKTTSHFVKYMVSNLATNQSQLQEDVKQIQRLLAKLSNEREADNQIGFAPPSPFLSRKETAPTLLQKLDDCHIPPDHVSSLLEERSFCFLRLLNPFESF